MAWSTADMGEQTGRVALITGANSGIGEPTARELGRAGAKVVIACRSAERAEAALARLRQAVPAAHFSFLHLDLGSLASVRRGASTFLAAHDRLDLLINNAGVMIPPYGETEDGFELQIGTNHLGHFALTALLIDRLAATPSSRVVTVASLAHRWGRIRFADLNHRRFYLRWLAYGQSKVANLLFTYELQRRLERAGLPTKALAAHPGVAATNLTKHSRLAHWFGPLLAQDAFGGAAPTLRAATDPQALGGSYFGPRWLEMRGPAVQVRSNRYSERLDVAARLWQLSSELTDVRMLD